MDAERERQRRKERYWRDPEAARAKSKEWQEKNRERAYSRQKKWRDANKERKAETNRRWYEANKARVVAAAKRWRLANPDRHAEIKRGVRERGRPKLAAYRLKNRERIQAKDRARLYGITADEFTAVIKKQRGLCAICKRPETAKHKGVVRTLCIDHCHDTGAVRGLLCSDCNKALGIFGDDPERLLGALEYLLEASDVRKRERR